MFYFFSIFLVFTRIHNSVFLQPSYFSSRPFNFSLFIFFPSCFCILVIRLLRPRLLYYLSLFHFLLPSFLPLPPSFSGFTIAFFLILSFPPPLLYTRSLTKCIRGAKSKGKSKGRFPSFHPRCRIKEALFQLLLLY